MKTLFVVWVVTYPVAVQLAGLMSAMKRSLDEQDAPSELATGIGDLLDWITWIVVGILLWNGVG